VTFAEFLGLILFLFLAWVFTGLMLCLAGVEIYHVERKLAEWISWSEELRDRVIEYMYEVERWGRGLAESGVWMVLSMPWAERAVR
jgi:hypothetical protein